MWQLAPVCFDMCAVASVYFICKKNKFSVERLLSLSDRCWVYAWWMVLYQSNSVTGSIQIGSIYHIRLTRTSALIWRFTGSQQCKHTHREGNTFILFTLKQSTLQNKIIKLNFIAQVFNNFHHKFWMWKCFKYWILISFFFSFLPYLTLHTLTS